jgi:hypothetical protein
VGWAEQGLQVDLDPEEHVPEHIPEAPQPESSRRRDKPYPAGIASFQG